MGGAPSFSRSIPKKNDERSHVFTRIAYLNTIMMFAASELMDAIRLSHINSAFRETLVDYAVCVWQQIAHLIVEQPGFASNFLYSFQAPKFCCNWAIRNVYAAGKLNANFAFFNGAKPALFVAIKTNNVAMMEFLLEMGASPDVGADKSVSGGGLPPLHDAVLGNNRALAKLLLERGASIDLAVVPSGPAAGYNNHTQRYAPVTMSAFDIAIKEQRHEMIQVFVEAMLKRCVDLSPSSSSSSSSSSGVVPPVSQAAIAMHNATWERMLLQLLAVGTGAELATLMKAELPTVVSPPSGPGHNSPIGRASACILHRANTRLVRKLVEEYSADLWCENEKGDTPILDAAREGNEERFMTLLPYYSTESALLHQNLLDGTTIMHHLARVGATKTSIEAVLAICKKKCLDIYSWSGAPPSSKCLIPDDLFDTAASMDNNNDDDDDVSRRKLAKRDDNHDDDAQGTISTAAAPAGASTAAVPSRPRAERLLPIHFALEGQRVCMELLLAHGADPESITLPSRVSAVQLAMHIHRPDMAELLIRRGASISDDLLIIVKERCKRAMKNSSDERMWEGCGRFLVQWAAKHPEKVRMSTSRKQEQQ